MLSGLSCFIPAAHHFVPHPPNPSTGRCSSLFSFRCPSSSVTSTERARASAHPLKQPSRFLPESASAVTPCPQFASLLLCETDQKQLEEEKVCLVSVLARPLVSIHVRVRLGNCVDETYEFIFSDISGRYNLAANFLFPWLLQSLRPLICYDPRALDVGAVL